MEFNSSNESQWHTQIISFSNVRWDLHKILITEIYLCVKQIINKEIWFWHVQRETTISELLLLKATSFHGWFLGITSSLCFSQTADISGPNFLIRRRLRESQPTTLCGKLCLSEDGRTLGAHRSMVRAMGHFREGQGSQPPHCIAHLWWCAIWWILYKSPLELQRWEAERGNLVSLCSG